MKQYLNLLQKVLDEGVWKENRTGIRTKGIIGAHMQYNLQEGFPIVTTKKTAFYTAIAEMLGFWRGYDHANQFRSLGCRIWDANANENETWLANPHRKGKDDLGRIYGVQSRGWFLPQTYRSGPHHVDQLHKVYNHLKQGIDDRREIVIHWNPGELDRMALPPCHLLYQFGIQDGELHLSMYQRSCDMALGVPFNIVGYSWLLSVMAYITGLRVGTFNHFLHDVHIYENHIQGVQEQLTRVPFKLPSISIDSDIKSLEDMDTWVEPNSFKLSNYEHHPAIKFDMAV